MANQIVAAFRSRTYSFLTSRIDEGVIDKILWPAFLHSSKEKDGDASELDKAAFAVALLTNGDTDAAGLLSFADGDCSHAPPS